MPKLKCFIIYKECYFRDKNNMCSYRGTIEIDYDKIDEESTCSCYVRKNITNHEDHMLKQERLCIEYDEELQELDKCNNYREDPGKCKECKICKFRILQSQRRKGIYIYKYAKNSPEVLREDLKFGKSNSSMAWKC